MKTPEEIKKGLDACLPRWDGKKLTVSCDDCAYKLEGFWCRNYLFGDAVTYIRQLESRLSQVERERDAAVKIIEDATTYLEDFGSGRFALMQLKKWNGPCPENTKGDSK